MEQQTDQDGDSTNNRSSAEDTDDTQSMFTSFTSASPRYWMIAVFLINLSKITKEQLYPGQEKIYRVGKTYSQTTMVFTL